VKCTSPKCTENAVFAFDIPGRKTEAACIHHASTWLTAGTELLTALYGSVTFRAVVGRHQRRKP